MDYDTTYNAIVTLVFETGIGVLLYNGLIIVKPWLKGLFAFPPVKSMLKFVKDKFDIDSAQAYDATIKSIVFVAAFFVAWSMGSNGDLLILIGRNSETSMLGFVLTALVVTSGDLVVDHKARNAGNG